MLQANSIFLWGLIFLSVETHTARGDTFYIVTSTDTPCPGEFSGIPCLTLRQYSLNPSQSPNVTLLFEPGTVYDHSFTLTISSGYNLTMSSDNATIRCTARAGIFNFNNIANVHISGMNFQRCFHALMLRRVAAATVSNCSFTENNANAAYGAGSCLFLDRTSVTIVNSVFQNNRAQWQGGAIYAITSTITIIRSTFNRTVVSESVGGAIRARTGSRIMVYDSTFGHNTARQSGGAIHCQEHNPCRFSAVNTVFIDNRARVGDGGAIYVAGQILSLANCPFMDNYAGNGGGAVHNQGGGNTVSIDGLHFSNNVAVNHGGALYIVGTRTSIDVSRSSFVDNAAVRGGGGAIYSNGRYANVSLALSTFTNNTASYCGVLDVDEFNHFSVNFTDSIFTRNTATGVVTGGGVACVRNATINIINSSFKNNHAVYHAGVLFVDESVVKVEDSLFRNNSALEDGGVFYTYVHASDYIIQRSQFSENSAGDDGGVMLIGRLNCFVSIDRSVFDFNLAGDRGGVIALIASSMYMEINDTNIYNNTAPLGGVISACNSQVTLVDNSLTATNDPILPAVCTLYGGYIIDFNITIPDPEDVITTAPPPTTPPPTTTTFPSATTMPPATTTVPPTTTAPPVTTGRPPTTTVPPVTGTTRSPTSSMPPTTTQSVPPPTSTRENPLTTSAESGTDTVAPPTTTDGAPPTTTDSYATTSNETSTTESVQAVNNVSITFTETTVSIVISLSIIAIFISLVAISGVCVLACLLFMRTKKSQRYDSSSSELHEFDNNEFTFNKNDFTMINY